MSNDSNSPGSTPPTHGLVVRERATDLFATPRDLLAAPIRQPQEEIQQADPMQRLLSLTLLYRNKWLILAVFLLSAIPAVALVWTSTPEQFTARGTIEILPGAGGAPERVNSSAIRLFISSQTALIRSQPVLARTLEDRDVQNTRWYNEEARTLFGAPLSRGERIQEAIGAGGMRGVHNLLNITATTLRPTDSAVLANAVIRAFIEYSRERQERNLELIYEQLIKQQLDLKQRVEGLEALTAGLRERIRTGDGDDLIKTQSSRIAGLQHQIEDLAREIDAAKHELTRLESAATQPSTRPDADQQLVYERDAEWTRLRTRIEQVRDEMELARARLGEQHPQIVSWRTQIEQLERKQREREEQLASRTLVAANVAGEQAVAHTPASLRQDIENREFRKRRLEEDLTRAKDRFNRDFEVVQTLNQHLAELARTREQLRQVQDNIASRELQRELPPAMRVFAEALPPSSPNNDKRMLNAGLACGGSLAFAIAVALARVFFTRSVQTLKDVPSFASAPFLGELPLATRNQAVPLEQCPIQGESMRMIRTALMQRMNGGSSSVVLITSAGAKAGKTTVSVMLGTSLARLGKRVLLVDADLRNPSLAKRFAMAQEPGLLAALQDRVNDTLTIREAPTPGLCVLTSGRVSDAYGAELLANGSFSECLARWKRSFDIVLLDSPPVLPVADARILARVADGTVLVVREGHCKRSEVVDCLAYLGLSGAKIVGTIFIGSHARHRYDYAYGAYGYAPGAANGAGG